MIMATSHDNHVHDDVVYRMMSGLAMYCVYVTCVARAVDR